MVHGTGGEAHRLYQLASADRQQQPFTGKAVAPQIREVPQRLGPAQGQQGPLQPHQGLIEVGTRARQAGADAAGKGMARIHHPGKALPTPAGGEQLLHQGCLASQGSHPQLLASGAAVGPCRRGANHTDPEPPAALQQNLSQPRPFARPSEQPDPPAPGPDPWSCVHQDGLSNPKGSV